MKTHFGLVLLLLLLLPGTGSGQGQSASPNPFLRLFGNGVWWVSLTRDAKDNFIDGYTTAMAHVSGLLGAECKQSMEDPKPSSDFNSQFGEALNLCMLTEIYDYHVDKIKLAKGIDLFYQDSRNTFVPIDYSFEYVRDELKGKKSAKDLEDELNTLRDTVKK